MQKALGNCSLVRLKSLTNFNWMHSAAVLRPKFSPICDTEAMLKDRGVEPPEHPTFRPKKVLILSKFSRLEIERNLHPDLSEEELKRTLLRRGSDYQRLRTRDDEHRKFLSVVEGELRNSGIETRTVQKFDYNDAAVSWADAIFSAGGDGTFLLAASRVKDPDKPVIGINTDPKGSEGYLCLLKKLSHEHFSEALKRLLAGDFRWLYRQRIRIRIEGDVDEVTPLEIQDQQLTGADWVKLKKIKATHHNGRKIVLPEPALNDVFIGETLSSRVSYYEIQCDGAESVKQKSSGIVVCTGSGSTSWYFNMNKVDETHMSDFLQALSEETRINVSNIDKKLLTRICDNYNRRLTFPPDCAKMAYCIRNPIFNATYSDYPMRRLVSRIRLRSRCFDAHLVIDGRVAYKFNDGAEAHFEIHPEDAVKTVIFR